MFLPIFNKFFLSIFFVDFEIKICFLSERIWNVWKSDWIKYSKQKRQWFGSVLKQEIEFVFISVLGEANFTKQALMVWRFGIVYHIRRDFSAIFTIGITMFTTTILISIFYARAALKTNNKFKKDIWEILKYL